MPKSKKTKPKHYHKQRDDFFKTHPRARILLGLLIVAFAYFIGQKYRTLRIHQAVGAYLDQEGIHYIPTP